MLKASGKTTAMNKAILDNAATPRNASLMLEDVIMYGLCVGNYVDVDGVQKIERVDPLKVEKDKQYVTIEFE